MANRIKDLRKKKNLKQSELAQMLHAGQSSVCAWEKGLYKPGEKDLFSLCKIFNCTPDYLMGYVDINLKEPQGEDNTITIFGRGKGAKRYKVSQKKLQAIQALLEDDNGVEDNDEY